MSSLTCIADAQLSICNIRGGSFNTLKNQGYHIEHDYGHGTNNLALIFFMLDMPAVSDWVMNSHKVADDPRTGPYEKLEQKLFAHAKDFGCEDLVISPFKVALTSKL